MQTSPGPAGVGATYRQTRTIPRPGEESLQITIFQPPTRLAIQGQIGPFQATTTYLLGPAAGGTRLTNTIELEPASVLLRPLGPLAVPRVKAAVASNLATLKRLLEAAPPTAETASDARDVPVHPRLRRRRMRMNLSLLTMVRLARSRLTGPHD